MASVRAARTIARLPLLVLLSAVACDAGGEPELEFVSGEVRLRAHLSEEESYALSALLHEFRETLKQLPEGSSFQIGSEPVSRDEALRWADRHIVGWGASAVGPLTNHSRTYGVVITLTTRGEWSFTGARWPNIELLSFNWHFTQQLALYANEGERRNVLRVVYSNGPESTTLRVSAPGLIRWPPVPSN